MEHKAINSSAIASVGYDDERNALEIRFRTGRVYRYHQVPASVYEQLLVAESAGSYFNDVIRANYEGELVYDPRRPSRNS